MVAEQNIVSALYKPSGYHSTPGAREPNVEAWLTARPGFEDRCLLHRLDQETSGLILFCHQESYEVLSKQVQKGHAVAKGYCALVEDWGKDCTPWMGKRALDGRGGEIQWDQLKSIRESLSNGQSQILTGGYKAFGPKGRMVRPVVQVSPRPGDYASTIVLEPAQPVNTRPVYLARVTISQGFRHQIRTHMATLGFPIIGDSLYHPEPRGRLMLHAASIGGVDQLHL